MAFSAMLRVASDLSAETLGWPYRAHGVVRTGARRARTMGFPTANLELPAGAEPADGVYAGWVRIGANSRVYPAMLYVGAAPTFGPGGRRLEVHLFDFVGDLYGRHLHVLFGVRVAGDHRHASPASLTASIRHLAAVTREALGC